MPFFLCCSLLIPRSPRLRVLKRIYFDGIACGNGAGGPLDQAKPVCYVEPRSNVLVNRELSLIELIYDEYNPLCVLFFL